MERQTVQVGEFAVNCTILKFGRTAWIVDPGQEADRIIGILENDGLTPEAILLTHAHFDHIGGIPGLQEKYPGLPVYVHPADVPVLTHPMNQMVPDYPPIGSVADLRSPHELSGVEVIETPGHTPGGVCYYFANDCLLLSGDTLFAGSVGRTDFPGGDMKTLMESLGRLTALPEETVVLPGHGRPTSIGEELRFNPFLRERS